jgi:hypothetical protein
VSAGLNWLIIVCSVGLFGAIDRLRNCCLNVFAPPKVKLLPVYRPWKASRLTDGGKAVSPMNRPRFAPQKRYFSASGIELC